LPAMKASYNWLRELCEFDLRPHELADRLSDAGLCVETYEPFGDDWMLDIEVTANRPDWLSHVGIAREIAALVGSTAKTPPFDINQGRCKFSDHASVRVTAPDLCPHYTARLIRRVRIGPSPDWLRQRLSCCGLRPVSNVVDATNYVLLETGQPLHAFDLSRLGGGKIVVRRARRGEVITAIDGTEHELDGTECVIADEFKPVAIAGVMGGMESEIGDSTTDILLESARFEPTNVRRTSRRLGLSSDSSYRFERGVDPENVEKASRRACQLIAELADGEIACGMADIRADNPSSRSATLRLSRLAHVLGIDVPRERVKSIFAGLQFDIVADDGEKLVLGVPSWRSDVEREIDLVEEVARVHGYDKISEKTDMPVRPAPLTKLQLCERKVRSLLVGMGFDELITHSLVPGGPLQALQPWCRGEPLRLRNPVSVEKSSLRLTMMPGLLRAKRFNAAHGVSRVNLFELGRVYLPAEDDRDGLPQEKVCLTLLTDADGGFFVLKGVLQNVMQSLGVEGKPGEALERRGPFREGQCLLLRLGARALGVIGTIAPDVAGQFDVSESTALMELDFDLLVEGSILDRPYAPVLEYPPVTRDLAIVIPERTRWADVENCIRENAPGFLQSVAYVETYRGQQVPKGHKSFTLSLTFRSSDRTLTHEEVDEAQRQILKALSAKLDAGLR